MDKETFFSLTQMDFLPEAMNDFVYHHLQQNDLAHDPHHIAEVVQAARSLFSQVDLSEREQLIVLLGAYLHDIGCHIDRKTHHLISSELFSDYIRDQSIEIHYLGSTYRLSELEEEVKCTIEQHRASYTGEKGTLSKIVSLADKGEIDPVNYLTRGFKYRSDATLTFEDKMHEVAAHFVHKYGPDGYAWQSFPQEGLRLYADKIEAMKSIFSSEHSAIAFILEHREMLESL